MGIGLDNVDELLCEVIFRALVVILENRGTNLGRRDGKDGTHHPIGTAPQTVEPHEVHILVTDATQKAMNILRLQKAAYSSICCATCFACEALPFCDNTAEVLVMVAMGLTCAATILSLLATAGDLLTSREDELPAVLALGATEGLRSFFADEELRALDTYTAEDLQDHLVELDLVDRAGELVVAKVARARVVILSTGMTEFAVLEDTHSGICEPSDFALLGTVGRHFNHCAASNLLRAEHPELDAHNGLRVRTVWKSGHTWYLSWFFRQGCRKDDVKFGDKK
jgi:hypothetical protein